PRADPRAARTVQGAHRPRARGAGPTGRDVLVSRAHCILPSARAYRRAAPAGGPVRLWARLRNAARHLTPLRQDRRRDDGGANRLARAVLLANELLPVLSALHALRV